MLVDKAKKYYSSEDYNCAESIIRAANENYNLGLSEDAIKLFSGFGGGLYSGKTCGAVCSSVAVIGQSAVGERAHITDGFEDVCGGFVEEVEKELGSVCCAELKEEYFKEDAHCWEVVKTTAEILEKYKEKNNL